MTNTLAEALEQCDGLLFVVPSHVARQVLQQLAPLLSRPLPIISATKGVEEDTFKLMTQVVTEVLPPDLARWSDGPVGAQLCHGSQPGPAHSPVSGRDECGARRIVSSRFITPTLRIYADSDVVGVQLGGALKNVMALAAGVVDGLGLGHNTRAAMITRGLAEMVRLGMAMGADPRTFYGLSGVGDLVLTCTGTLSRNHHVGVRLGQGDKLDADSRGDAGCGGRGADEPGGCRVARYDTGSKCRLSGKSMPCSLKGNRAAKPSAISWSGSPNRKRGIHES